PAAQGKLARQGQVRRKRIVEQPEWIGRESHSGEEVLQFVHFICGYPDGRALEIGEGAVKVLNPILVSAPVKRLVADDGLQGLRRHRTFHGMKAVGGVAATSKRLIVTEDTLDDICLVAEVPSQPVKAGVDVAGAARQLAQPGSLVRVVDVGT